LYKLSQLLPKIIEIPIEMDVRVIICLIFVVLVSLPESSENRYDVLQSNNQIYEDGAVERLMQDGSDELSDDDDDDGDDDDDNNEILRHDPRPFGRRRRFRRFNLRFRRIRTCFRTKQTICRWIRPFNRWIYICPNIRVRKC